MASGTKEQTELIVADQKIMITHPNKPLWPEKGISKYNYLTYLIQISEHLLPFLIDRPLTVIRYPHGVGDLFFYQKNCPAYAPSFIHTAHIDGIRYILCQDLATLLWLGNQAALELHLPFQTIQSNNPSEIVFDLDPPSRDHFSLAVEAALLIYDILQKLKIISFIKTSGNKGLQIYIPLPDQRFSYEETGRFTRFLSQYLVSKEPKWFTTERLKKNRGKKLYVDYLQHAQGKTIIAPYSVRGNEEALVATPLFWYEVQRQLRPEQFPLPAIIPRIKKLGCPFSHFQAAKEKQPFQPVLSWLTDQGF